MIKKDDNIADPTYVPAKILAKEIILNTWKIRQNLLEVFWKLWREDFLLSLPERSQIKLKLPQVEAKEVPSKEDIV